MRRQQAAKVSVMQRVLASPDIVEESRIDQSSVVEAAAPTAMAATHIATPSVGDEATAPTSASDVAAVGAGQRAVPDAPPIPLQSLSALQEEYSRRFRRTPEWTAQTITGQTLSFRISLHPPGAAGPIAGDVCSSKTAAKLSVLQ